MHKTSRRTGKRKEVASVLFPFHPFNLTIHTPCSCVTYAMWCYNDIKIDWNYSLAMKWHFFLSMCDMSFSVIWVSQKNTLHYHKGSSIYDGHEKAGKGITTFGKWSWLLFAEVVFFWPSLRPFVHLSKK